MHNWTCIQVEKQFLRNEAISLRKQEQFTAYLISSSTRNRGLYLHMYVQKRIKRFWTPRIWLGWNLTNFSTQKISPPSLPFLEVISNKYHKMCKNNSVKNHSHFLLSSVKPTSFSILTEAALPLPFVKMKCYKRPSIFLELKTVRDFERYYDIIIKDTSFLKTQ